MSDDVSGMLSQNDRKKGESKRRLSQLASVVIVALAAVVIAVCALDMRNDNQALAQQVTSQQVAIADYEATVKALRESSGRSITVAEAESMASEALRQIEALVDGLQGSPPSDQRVALMGAFCGYWVDWRRYRIEDYVDGEPYPLLRFKDNVEVIYEQIVEHEGGDHMNFIALLEKSCMVV